ncbi:MAG: glycosyl hydrolase [Geminicoccaceae bacterium]
MRRPIALTAVVASLIAFTATPAHAGNPTASAAAAPRDFAGLVSEDTLVAPTEYRRAQFADQAALGIRLLRQTFAWSSIEVSPDTYDFDTYDAYVGDAARAGLSILPIVFRAPDFRGGGASTHASPPTKYDDIGTFAAVLVRRYGPNGSFWSENPDIPKLPIRAWQIWNEPNLKAYWPRPNAKQYTQLLKAAYKPIKAADSGAQIVTAGMPESRIGVPLKKFIPAMYKAGAKKWFDVLAINPYGHTAGKVIANIANSRKIMKKFHDSAPIWATEIGWSDVGPSGPQRVGSQGQAAQLRNVVKLLARKRRSLKLRGFVYFDWRDGQPFNGKDFWGLHTGLLNIEGQPKPAYSALQQALAALR